MLLLRVALVLGIVSGSPENLGQKDFNFYDIRFPSSIEDMGPYGKGIFCNSVQPDRFCYFKEMDLDCYNESAIFSNPNCQDLVTFNNQKRSDGTPKILITIAFNHSYFSQPDSAVLKLRPDPFDHPDTVYVLNCSYTPYLAGSSPSQACRAGCGLPSGASILTHTLWEWELSPEELRSLGYWSIFQIEASDAVFDRAQMQRKGCNLTVDFPNRFDPTLHRFDMFHAGSAFGASSNAERIHGPKHMPPKKTVPVPVETPTADNKGRILKNVVPLKTLPPGGKASTISAFSHLLLLPSFFSTLYHHQ